MFEETVIIDDRMIDISLNNYVSASSKIRKKQVLIIVSGGVLGCSAFLSLFRIPFAVSVIMLLAGIFLMIYGGFYYKKTVLKRMKKKAKSLLGVESRQTFDDEGITVTWPNREFRIRWADLVKRIEPDEEYIHITYKDGRVSHIEKKKLSEDEIRTLTNIKLENDVSD